MSSPKRVVVVGSGASGLAAAVSAAHAGATVTVIESASALGGTTASSGGAIWVPGNRWAAAAGVKDSADDGTRYLDALLEVGDGDMDVAASYVHGMNPMLDEIERSTGITWQHMIGFTDYHAELPGGCEGGRGLEPVPIVVPGDAAGRVRPNPYGVVLTTVNEASGAHPLPDEDELRRRQESGTVTRGSGLVAALYAALVSMGGRALTDRRARELVVDGGAVTGVLANGERFEGSVVIASGGFERNDSLVRTFLRGQLLGPAGPPSMQGDGLVMGMSAGAALGNMSEAWWCPAIHIPGESIDGAPFFRMIFTECGHPGGVLVDGLGRRFVDEATNYNDLGRSLQLFNAATFEHVVPWLVFDARRYVERPFGGDVVWLLQAPRDSIEDAAGRDKPDWIRSASTLEALAGEIGIEPVNLVATVERFNAHIASGGDRDFGRGSYAYDRFCRGAAEPRGVTEPPYYALRVLPGSLGTKGGLRTDADARVLRPNGDLIEGLYAAGNAAASPFGAAYPGPGATIGPGLYFGWQAGRAAAA